MCLNGILWRKYITRHRKYNIANTIIKSMPYRSISERLTEKNKENFVGNGNRCSKNFCKNFRNLKCKKWRYSTIDENIAHNNGRHYKRQLTCYGYEQSVTDNRLLKRTTSSETMWKRKRKNVVWRYRKGTEPKKFGGIADIYLYFGQHHRTY